MIEKKPLEESLPGALREIYEKGIETGETRMRCRILEFLVGEKLEAEIRGKDENSD